jgi:predicted esterase
MTDRARLSKRPSYTTTSPPGRTFLGSPDFPPSLIAAVQAHDPVGILFGTRPIASPTNQSETARLRQVLDATLRGKHVLKCSGGSDKLVPYAAAKPFMDFLTEATRPGGWWEGGVSIDDRIYEGVAHEFTGEMVEDSVNWLVGLLEKQGGEGGKGRRDSNL